MQIPPVAIMSIIGESGFTRRSGLTTILRTIGSRMKWKETSQKTHFAGAGHLTIVRAYLHTPSESEKDQRVKELHLLARMGCC